MHHKSETLLQYILSYNINIYYINILYSSCLILKIWKKIIWELENCSLSLQNHRQCQQQLWQLFPSFLDGEGTEQRKIANDHLTFIGSLHWFALELKVSTICNNVWTSIPIYLYNCWRFIYQKFTWFLEFKDFTYIFDIMTLILSFYLCTEYTNHTYMIIKISMYTLSI